MSQPYNKRMQQTDGEVHEQVRLSGEVDAKGIVQATKLTIANTNKILWDFEIQTDHPYSVQKSEQVLIYKLQERTYPLVEFAVSAKHRRKAR